MTNEEAIKKIKYRIDTASHIAGKGVDGKAFEDLEMAIQALEKQTSAKVVYEEFPSGYRHYQCPVCGMTAIYSWCFWCGQALDLTEMQEWRKPIIEEIAEGWHGPTCYSFIQPKGD